MCKWRLSEGGLFEEKCWLVFVGCLGFVPGVFGTVSHFSRQQWARHCGHAYSDYAGMRYWIVHS
jgi:hypothetical protein